MALFRFVVVGAPQQPVMEVDGVHSISELHQVIARSRFVEGRLEPEHCKGANCGALIATSRIQMVMEVE